MRSACSRPHPKRTGTDGEKGLETELFYIGLWFLALGIGAGAAYYFWLRDCLPQLPCVFYSVFGVYCPGCGGTRAVGALFRGQFLLSIWYHPLVLYGGIIGGGFMATQGMERLGFRKIRGWRFHSWYLYGAVIVTVVNFVLKNILLTVWNVTL